MTLDFQPPQGTATNPLSIHRQSLFTHNFLVPVICLSFGGGDGGLTTTAAKQLIDSVCYWNEEIIFVQVAERKTAVQRQCVEWITGSDRIESEIYCRLWHEKLRMKIISEKCYTEITGIKTIKYKIWRYNGKKEIRQRRKTEDTENTFN